MKYLSICIVLAGFAGYADSAKKSTLPIYECLITKGGRLTSTWTIQTSSAGAAVTQVNALLWSSSEKDHPVATDFDDIECNQSRKSYK